MCTSLFFFFNDTATTEIYTLSLHDALPISLHADAQGVVAVLGHVQLADLERRRLSFGRERQLPAVIDDARDRKSTRLNSSHANISYAVFCLKKKKKHIPILIPIFTIVTLYN